ncbi:MAG TPA: NIPSNAP family protein [Candidatus Sulfopaludibacter sp.]|jgi:hypothetical protein|nr:NIPSNAP family protein [Candidatus Sulfopaludibacter sp.]
MADTAPAAGKRAFFELRYFRMRNGPQTERTTRYLQRGWLPAAQRAGIGPVGFFNSVFGPQSPFILSLSSYPSLAAMETAQEKLAADKDFQAAFDDYNSMTELSYIRMETSLLHAFPSIPGIEVPPARQGGGSRTFELRTYESPNEKAGARKVKMFDDAEIAIFRRSGMTPIFFGQTMIGTNQPSLTYMLAYDDLAARDKAWSAFGKDPEWQKLRATPGLTDPEIVSNISNAILRPLAFSPIR